MPGGRGSRQKPQLGPEKQVEELNLRSPSNIVSTFGKGAAARQKSLQAMPFLHGSDLPYSDSSEDVSLSAIGVEDSDADVQVQKLIRPALCVCNPRRQLTKKTAHKGNLNKTLLSTSVLRMIGEKIPAPH